jgi:hypothetical protein
VWNHVSYIRSIEFVRYGLSALIQHLIRAVRRSPVERVLAQQEQCCELCYYIFYLLHGRIHVALWGKRGAHGTVWDVRPASVYPRDRSYCADVVGMVVGGLASRDRRPTSSTHYTQ